MLRIPTLPELAEGLFSEIRTRDSAWRRVASRRKDACRRIVAASPTVTTSCPASICTNRYLMSTGVESTVYTCRAKVDAECDSVGKVAYDRCH